MPKFPFNKSFEDELAGKSGEFRMEPSPDLWKGIEKGLDQPGFFQAHYKWMLGAAGAVAVALFLLMPADEIPMELTVENKTGFFPRAEVISGQERKEAGTARNTLPSDKPEGTLKPVKPTGLFPELSTDGIEIEGLGLAEPLAVMIIPREAPAADPERTNQEQENKTKSQFPVRAASRWYMEASATTYYSHRNMQPRSDAGRMLSDQRRASERATFGYQVSGGVRYYFTGQFSISGGFSFSKTFEQIWVGRPMTNPQIDSMAEANGFRKEEMFRPGKEKELRNEFTQWELPVLIHRQKKWNEDWSYGWDLGLSLVHIRSRAFHCYDFRMQHYVPDQKFLRNWNMNFYLGGSVNYHAGERLILSAGPQIRYSFFSTLRDTYPLIQNQYGLGLNLGLQWRLFDTKMASAQ